MTLLTDDEKEKIKQEDEYRGQLKKDSGKPKSLFDKLDGPIKVLQGITIALAIFASLWQYHTNSIKAREEAARDYQKSFYQEQMKVYAEAVNQASVISTASPDSPAYREARQKFLELFWGRMSMFEDKCVEAKMVEFRELLIKFEREDFSPVYFPDPCMKDTCVFDTVDQVSLKMASLRLAHQCRVYTINTWLTKDDQVKYNLDTVLCTDQ
ncbi:MAG TPA: hypothetical protein VE978_24390 [Chitinophagales bacterium]|nr:hypothetical protein [Chitinophagales bacterium]